MTRFYNLISMRFNFVSDKKLELHISYYVFNREKNSVSDMGRKNILKALDLDLCLKKLALVEQNNVATSFWEKKNSAAPQSKTKNLTKKKTIASILLVKWMFP